MSGIWELDLPQNEKLVALAFADHANDEGLCFPSVERVAWKTGYKRRQTQKLIAKLVERGILEPEAFEKGGRGHSTLYRVRPEKGAKIAPFVGRKGRTPGHQGAHSRAQKGALVSAPQPFITIREPGVARLRLGENYIGNLQDRANPPSCSRVKEPKLPHVGEASDGKFRKHLERGIYRRGVAAAYFDLITHGKSQGEAIRGACEEAALSLTSNRGSSELRSVTSERIAAKAWERIQPHVKAFAEIRDFERRRDHVVGAVVNAVVDATLELRGG